MSKTVRNSFVIVLVLAIVGLLGVLEVKRQTISADLTNIEQEVEAGQLNDAQADNQKLADQIIADVRSLIDIPDDIEPTVATIIDVEQLRARNPFYDKAENGDHLVVTRERAILYSSKLKKIIDVVPVQLEPAEAPAAAPEATE